MSWILNPALERAAGFFFADITQDGYEEHLRNLKAALASAYRAGYAAAQTKVGSP